MHRPAAIDAVEDEPPEFALEVALHLEELEPQVFGAQRHGV
jgi:hypothetical protein